MSFSCGLTAFSNLLQPIQSHLNTRVSCGLTAFSNLLQREPSEQELAVGCGLTAFSNLLQPTGKDCHAAHVAA